MDGILILVAIAVVAFIVIVTAISRLLLISEPNEVIILSGRKRTMTDGKVVGYRVIRGGRAMRIPLIEKASRMSLETIPIVLSITNAYSKGGIPLAVDAIANIKIDSKEPSFGNAVERFLTMSEEEIQNIARENLEGNLRGVLASLTPEEVNEDRMKFADSLMDEADIDLQKLGIQLDTLKITNIADERGYLDSIGRMKSAEVIARAKKAEADKRAEAEEAEAASIERAEKAKASAKQEIQTAQILTDQNIAVAEATRQAVTQEAEAESQERGEKAKAQADQEIRTAQNSANQNVAISQANKIAETREAEAAARTRAETAKAMADQQVESAIIDSEKNVKVTRAQAEQNVEIERNNLRVKKAELEKEAIIKEKEAEVAGHKAQAKFEQELEDERILLQKKRLTADVIEPAKAKKEAAELEAKGQSASIIADGEARIFVLNQTIQAYLSAEGKGDKVMMLNMLPQLTETLVSTIKDIKIDKMTIVESGDGQGQSLQKLVNQFPGSVVSLTEMVENATGVDILSSFRKDKEV
jgi:flotillin